MSSKRKKKKKKISQTKHGPPKQTKIQKQGERGTDFPAPDLPIRWANTGGLSVLRLHFWQTEQPFSR